MEVTRKGGVVLTFTGSISGTFFKYIDEMQRVTPRHDMGRFRVCLPCAAVSHNSSTWQNKNQEV